MAINKKIDFCVLCISYFSEYPQESRAKRLLLLQEEIAVRFGFIRCRGNATTYRNHDQYVHLTGNKYFV